jgi:poly(hydroxyalkanoate) depolymerase family esterase
VRARALRIAPLVAALAVAAAGTARGEVIPGPDPGRLEHFTMATPEGEADYLVYTPSTVDSRTPVPLYVMTHGCNTTALQQARADLHHPVAERERFVVLYPDFAPATHPVRCWRWTDPASQQRDGGDPATIAAETRAVMAHWNIDAQRVYAMGMSSGAFMTSILGATYPDLYAAIGIMAGGPYRTYACLGDRGAPRPQAETPELAQGAYDAMGSHARVVPVIELHGTADNTVPPPCGEQAIEQWLRTDNLVITHGARQDGPLALSAARTRTVAEPGRRAAQVRDYVDAQGCLVAEKWDIAGMDHFWTGGTTDPQYAAFTDPTGPNGAEATWAFFKHFRRDDTNAPCAPAARSACHSRRAFALHLPRSAARRPRVTLAGRRLRIHGSRRPYVMVDLRGRPAGIYRVRVGGRVVRSFRTCARRHGTRR